MSQKFKIFVEGSTDSKFIVDLVQNRFNAELEREQVVVTGGFGRLFCAENLTQLERIQDEEGINLVIFDTDREEHISEESFEIRKSLLVNQAEDKKIEIKLFLFPNNRDDGDLELLLQQIANPVVYKPFSACFEPYFDCLHAYNRQYQSETGKDLKVWPEKIRRKLALINFLNFHYQESNANKRNYTDTNFWDLNSPALNPLIAFLRPHFS